MRISATTLESFRLYEVDVITEAEFTASIAGKFVPTPRVLLGRAYDQVLERPEHYRVADGYACDGYRFEADTVDPALATIDRAGLFQVKATKIYGAHTVVTKVDHVLGGEVGEFKTRIGSYDWSRYAASYQWRLELDILAAEAITYRVFCLRQDPISLRSIETLRLYPYPALAADCQRIVERFDAWTASRGLQHYLPDRRAIGGPAFEDSPTRPSSSARLRSLRERVAAAAEEARDALPPIAELPTPTFTLRHTHAAQPQQTRLW